MKDKVQFKVNLPPDLVTGAPATGIGSVVKIKVGGKIYIAKTHNQIWLANELVNMYGKYQRELLKEDNLYYPVIKYAVSKGIQEIYFETLYSNVSGYRVLVYELEMLAKYFGKRNCLNANNVPYVPKTNYERPGAYTWLQRNEELNYTKQLKKWDF